MLPFASLSFSGGRENWKISSAAAATDVNAIDQVSVCGICAMVQNFNGLIVMTSAEEFSSNNDEPNNLDTADPGQQKGEAGRASIAKFTTTNIRAK